MSVTLGQGLWGGDIGKGVAGIGHSGGCFWQGHFVGYSGAGALGVVLIGTSFRSFGLGSER